MRSAIAQVPGWDPLRVKAAPLKGGITNQNFKIETAAGVFVLKLDGKWTEVLGINRDNEWACALIAAELGIGPELYHFMPKARSLVTRFIEGEPVSHVAAGQPEMLKRIVASIKRLHSGPAFPGRFSPFETVRVYHLAFGCHNAERAHRSLPKGFGTALELMNQLERSLKRGPSLCPCHNDLLASNLIDDGRTIRILDWEYAAMGDPFFDLGNFAINQQLDTDRRRLLLQEYFNEVRDADLARLNLYGLASDLREAAWGFLQSKISKIEFDFFGYGTKHLDRFLSSARGPQFERWLEEAATR